MVTIWPKFTLSLNLIRFIMILWYLLLCLLNVGYYEIHSLEILSWKLLFLLLINSLKFHNASSKSIILIDNSWTFVTCGSPSPDILWLILTLNSASVNYYFYARKMMGGMNFLIKMMNLQVHQWIDGFNEWVIVSINY